MQSLPSEVAAMILSFAEPRDRMSFACASKASWEAARSPEAWGHRMALGRAKGAYGLLQPGSLTSLVRLLSPPDVRALDLSGQWYVPAQELRAALESWGATVEELGLDECGQLTGSDLAGMAPLMPGLRALRVGKWRFLTDEGPAAVLAAAPRLESLHAPFSRRLTDGGFLRVLGASGRALVELDLSFCTRLSDARALAAVARASPGLVRLRLDSFEAVADDTIAAVAEHCHSLAELSVARCRRLTDAAPLALAGSPAAATLTRLNFSQCTQIGDAGLAPLVAATAPRLVRLLLSQVGLVTDRTLDALAAGRPHRLTHLKLSFCRRITGDGLTRVAGEAPALALADLEYCKQLDDADVAPLLASCARLATLNVSHCRVNGSHLDALLPPGAGARLTRLFASHTPLEGAGVLQRCPRLHRLDLSFCLELPPDELLRVPGLCPALRHLSVATDDEVAAALRDGMGAGASVRNFSGGVQQARAFPEGA